MNLGMKKENHNKHTGKTKKGRIDKNRRPRQYYSVSKNLNVPCGRHKDKALKIAIISYYAAWHCLSANVLLSTIIFLIFVVFDV